jgi:hypothetical protein
MPSLKRILPRGNWLNLLLDPSLCKDRIYRDSRGCQGTIPCPDYTMFPLFMTQYQPIIAQDERDQAMKLLCEAMNDAYGYVNAHLRLRDNLDEDRKSIILRLSLQTVDCAYFIRDKSSAKNFCEYFYYFTILSKAQNAALY